MKIYNCLFCNKECLFDGRKTNKYCAGTTCQVSFQNLERVERWLATGIIGNKTSQTPQWLRKYILSKQDGKCAECGIAEWNNKPIVFELEHKDGNSENNAELNLSLLCPNCHSQTPTYKGANRGNGRHSRRERYKASKSF
jgi:5-methylcytosine-specific restriction endonuclease McrA